MLRTGFIFLTLLKWDMLSAEEPEGKDIDIFTTGIIVT